VEPERQIADVGGHEPRVRPGDQPASAEQARLLGDSGDERARDALTSEPGGQVEPMELDDGRPRPGLRLSGRDGREGTAGELSSEAEPRRGMCDRGDRGVVGVGHDPPAAAVLTRGGGWGGEVHVEHLRVERAAVELVVGRTDEAEQGRRIVVADGSEVTTLGPWSCASSRAWSCA
jgi:hypothetical protein